ncbi:MAG: hypothetical protein KatS3mg097_491 [Candidatus Parcubacteria bacterium]|nr:MAG: hypothetical protein KatS3mg097_491 [Candidatus Parcubacteria bacterium]
MNHHKESKYIIGSVVLGIVIGIFIFVSGRYLSNFTAGKYVGVFFNNGNVYFGKLSVFPQLKLKNAIFLTQGNNGGLYANKLSDIQWAPVGDIYFDRSAVAFIMPLKENSPLIQVIEGTPANTPTTQQTTPLNTQSVNQNPNNTNTNPNVPANQQNTQTQGGASPNVVPTE